MLLTGRIAVYTVSDMKYINRSRGQNAEILGAFTKWRKGTVSSVMFICSSACTRLPMGKFSWNFMFEYGSKISWKFTFHENMTILIGTLEEDQCIFMTTSSNSSQNEKCFKVGENQNTYFVFNNFFFRKSGRLWENVKNKVRPDRP